jgi:tetratricopeptide (TPR) repeat protein
MLPGSPTALIEYTGNRIRWENVRIEILNAIKKRMRTTTITLDQDKAAEEEIDSIQQILHDPAQATVAENKLKMITEKYPNSSRSYYYLGRFYNERGNYEKAVETFKKGEEKNPKDAVLYWGIAMAYLKLKDPKLAMDSVNKALELGLEPHLQKHARSLLKTLQQRSS